MLKYYFGLTAFLIVPLLMLPAAQGQKKTLQIKQEWSGARDDDALLKGVPQCITSAAGFDKLWKKWKLAGMTPGVDFDRELIVIATTAGSKIHLEARLGENGNLEPLGVATSDFLPGFRFVIGVVDRAGVKTVNGKKLPRE